MRAKCVRKIDRQTDREPDGERWVRGRKRGKGKIKNK